MTDTHEDPSRGDWAGAAQSGNWSLYQSKGLILAAVAPGPITFTGPGAFPSQVATVVEPGTGAATADTMQ